MRVAAILLFMVLLTACQPRWQTLDPGQEERFAALVEPAAEELRPDWEWHNAWVDETTVTITYGPLGAPPISCHEAPVCLQLVHPSQASGEDLLVGEFALRVAAHEAGETVVAEGRLVSGLASRLEAAEGFWRSHPGWALVLLEGAVALLLMALLGALLLRRTHWRAGVLFVGFTWAAWAWRWFAVPVGPFHENHHGLINAFNVVAGGPPVHHVTSSHFALMQVFVQWFGGSEGAFYATAALLGALAALLWGLVAQRISGSRLAGWLAAASFAVMPLAVRMAATETPFVLATLLLPAAALALAVGLERLPRAAGWAAITLGVMLLALLGQARIITLLMPPVAILLAVAMVPRWEGRQWWALAGATTAAGLLLIPHLYEVLQAAEERAAEARYVGLGSLSESLLGMRLLPLRPEYVAPTLLPLAVVGGVWLVLQQRRRGVAVVLALAWAVVATGLVSTCTSLHLALELPLVGTLTAISAVGILAIGDLLPPGWLGRGMVAALALTTLLPWSVLALAPPEVQEYQFIEAEVLPLLQREESAVLFVAPEGGQGRMAIPLRWWQTRLPNVAVRPWGGEKALPQGAFVYRGLSEIPVVDGCDERGLAVASMALGSVALEREVVPPEDRFLCGGIPRCGKFNLMLLRWESTVYFGGF